MRAINKLLAASAAALSVAAIAAPANAIVYLDFADSSVGSTISWTRTTNGTPTGNDDVGGVLFGSGQINLNIFDTVLSDGPASILTNFVINGTDSTQATKNNSEVNQWEVNGSFSFVSVNAFTYNGHNFAAGTNVLSATFTSGDLGGIQNGLTGKLFAQDGVDGATVNFSSSVLSQDQAYFMDTMNFRVTQLAVGQGFSAFSCDTPFSGVQQCDNSLRSFNGNVTGTFSAAVPETGTWALMILGFGGAGAMIRSRRRTAVAA